MYDGEDVGLDLTGGWYDGKSDLHTRTFRATAKIQMKCCMLWYFIRVALFTKTNSYFRQRSMTFYPQCIQWTFLAGSIEAGDRIILAVTHFDIYG